VTQLLAEQVAQHLNGGSEVLLTAHLFLEEGKKGKKEKGFLFTTS
jgi:hypothetical protein